jgi:hypothetical protein
MNGLPIACTLTADALLDRKSEWNAFLATMVKNIDIASSHATLTLVGGADVLVGATDLAERERACCPFFRFSLELDGDGTRLHIQVPAEAHEILIGLLTIAQASLNPT